MVVTNIPCHQNRPTGKADWTNEEVGIGQSLTGSLQACFDAPEVANALFVESENR